MFPVSHLNTFALPPAGKLFTFAFLLGVMSCLLFPDSVLFPFTLIPGSWFQNLSYLSNCNFVMRLDSTMQKAAIKSKKAMTYQVV